MDRLSLKRRLRDLRERAGISSARQLAARLGVSNMHVSAIEKESADDLPSIELLIAWVEECGGDVIISVGDGDDVLMDLAGMLHSEDAELVSELARLLLEAPPTVRALLREQFRAMIYASRTSTAPTTSPRSIIGEASKG